MIFHYWDTNGVRHDQQMSFNLVSRRWVFTVNNNVNWPPGELVYWITASDRAGNDAATSAPPAGGPRLHKGQCFL